MPPVALELSSQGAFPLQCAGRGLRRFRQDKGRVAETNLVTKLHDRRALDAPAIHESAIGRVQIRDFKVIFSERERCVAARDAGPPNHKLVILATSDDDFRFQDTKFARLASASVERQKSYLGNQAIALPTDTQCSPLRECHSTLNDQL
jgi:hypothetical protein